MPRAVLVRVANSLCAASAAALEWRVLNAAARNFPGLLAAHNAPGVQFALALDDRPIRTLCRGRMSLAAGDSVANTITDTTRFAISSLTKPTAAYITLRCAHQYAINIDLPIAQLLSRSALRSLDLPPHFLPITIRQLLSHSGGLPCSHPPYTDHAPLTPPECLRNQPRDAKPSDPASPPCALYSGLNYAILEAVLTSIRACTFADIARDALPRSSAGSLNLIPDFSFDWSRPPEVAADHEADGTQLPLRYPGSLASSGMICTATGLVRLFQILLADARAESPDATTLLPAHLARELFTPQPFDPNDPASAKFTLGMHLFKDVDPIALDHGGNRTGFRAILLVVPRARLVAAAFCNSSAGFRVVQPLIGLIRELALARPYQ